MLTCTAVIARYEEDVSWVRQLLCPAIIYNKGSSPTGLENSFTAIMRPNVGRESETYLHHILSHYDTLPNHLIFLQGNPFDHCPALFDALDSHSSREQTIPLAGNWKRETLEQDYNWAGFKECLQSLSGLIELTSPILGYGTGAQYIVSREAILKHPRILYERLLSRVNHSIDPLEGWAMERLWGRLFGLAHRTEKTSMEIIVHSSHAPANQSFVPMLRENLEQALAIQDLSVRIFLSPNAAYLEGGMRAAFGSRFTAVLSESVPADAQDHILYISAEHPLGTGAIMELLESYAPIKLHLPGEADCILDISADPLASGPVLHGPMRSWRQTTRAPRSFLTHTSLLMQHPRIIREGILPTHIPTLSPSLSFHATP